jgi:hypothetical protein
MLDTRTYEIEFPDGRIDEYTANVIDENMEGIIDHKTYGHAVDHADMYIKH